MLQKDESQEGAECFSLSCVHSEALTNSETELGYNCEWDYQCFLDYFAF